MEAYPSASNRQSLLSSPTLPLWRAPLLWLALVAVLLFINRDILFHQPICEVYDFAANALQINSAKAGREIEGNYSRWKFHHPGPALFYVYAAGEILFYDWLQLTASPHGAHVLAGILLQTACVVAAVEIAARRIAHPWFFPFAAFWALVHFTNIRLISACVPLVSIWPPNVLIGPLCLFMVAAAALAAGSRWMIPVCVLTGGLLVHSHVAQVMFVVPLFLCAMGGYVWNRRGDPKAGESAWANLRGPIVTAGVILALFLLPMAIEFFSRPDNNFVRYTTTKDSESQHRPPRAAIGYWATFLIYGFTRQEMFDEDQVVYFWRLQWPLLVVWLFAAGVVARELFGAPSRRADGGADIRFWRALYVLWSFALLILLVWSRFLAGPLFFFNTYFAYALTFLGSLLAWACLVRRLRPRGSFRTAGIASAVVPLALLLTPQLWQTEASAYPSPEIRNQVLAVVERHPPGDRPVVLRFTHDDWGVALATALQLQRAGVDVRVGETWEWKFGRRMVYRPEFGPPAYYWIVSAHDADLKAPGVPQVMERAVLIRPTEPADAALRKSWKPRDHEE